MNHRCWFKTSIKKKPNAMYLEDNLNSFTYLYCDMSFLTCVGLFGGSRRVLLVLPSTNSNFNSRGGPYSKEKDHGCLDVS